MGGPGSGCWYRWNAKRTTEGALPLDIRELARMDLLVPGRRISSRWSRNGHETGSIGGRVYDRYLLLQYRFRETEQVEQRINFDWTSCNFGGKRIWFLCPNCGRSCAVKVFPSIRMTLGSMLLT